ncbi:DMT family transporter [Cognatishimia sp. MH4019]|uniref:DMT family transporter n=1 Tax=Cognatishimia sp. MH4019 TaxID=2854030 RepID=UPI001CD325DE|nr:EamA family transporter [Cognatishimia sp. MH4019]
MDKPGAINWLRIVGVAMIWGSAFMTVSIALRDFEPLTLAAGRIVIGAGALYALLKLRGGALHPFSDRKVWVFTLGIALLSSAWPFMLLSWGQQHVASGFAGMTMAALPIFVLPLAHFLVPGDRLTLRKGIGFAIGFVGTVWLIGPGTISEISSDTEALARMACVAAALCYAVGSIVTRLCPEVNQLALSTASLILAAVFLVPLALLVEGVPREVAPQGWLALLYLGVVPTAVAFIIKVAVIRSAGPSFMTLTNYMVPVWSVLFGALILSEKLPAQLFGALALILVGIAISQAGTLRKLFA